MYVELPVYSTLDSVALSGAAILQIRKLRLRVVKLFVQVHSADKW